MKDDYVTKKDLQDFGEKLEQRIEQKLDQKIEQKLEEKLEPIRYDLNKLGVTQEQMMHSIQAIIEMLAPNLERTTDHGYRIVANEEKIKEHDIQIGVLQKK